ncbi:MAG: glycosyl transferase [Blastocatellia bacterium]|nr:glycosyl transferase [Blastocatellia bacterium]MCX7753340.1 glycosyl transferase [Blastocatellia bacterium]MDW8168095.1 glycosyl transferase [Acidobacteriota bacterium]
MADFHQTGVIATLHRLVPGGLERLERELVTYAEQRPIALVLPALYSEFEGPAMPRIIEELRQVPYLRQIVVTMSQATPEQYARARQMMAGLPQEVIFIWNDGPRLQKLYEKLQENGLPVGADGKGRSCWMAYGYVLASGKSDVIALHDCDILTYTREMLARLCYPVVNPNIDFEFCKGYYARVTDRLHGRVTRLFVTPLVRSLLKIFGSLPFLEFLDSFRYPLAGEFAMMADLARINRIPGDWGLEVGVLAEIYRNRAVRRICQVELCETYEHKHQVLSPDDPTRGLMKMAVDIAKTLFRTLSAEGVVFTSGAFRTLRSTYIRTAEDMISRYHADALINGLVFDRHEEEVAVEAFARALHLAAEAFMEDPLGVPLIPNWNRVTAALPEFFDELLEVVREDNS